MTRWITGGVLAVLALLATGQLLHRPESPQRSQNEAMTAVATTPVSAELQSATPPLKLDGRSSFSLAASAPELAAGRVRARGWNLAFFRVPQRALTRDEDTKPVLGFLGFAVSGEDGELAYDADALTLTGELKGYVDSAYLGTIQLPPGLTRGQPLNDLVETAYQPALLSVHVELPDRLEPAALSTRTLVARFSAILQVFPNTFDRVHLPGYKLDLREEDVSINIASPETSEVLRSLCVQPVNISRPGEPDEYGMPTTETSGMGLEFGKPAVELQWDKADTAFVFRDFETVNNEAYWIIDGSVPNATVDALYATLEVEECIEVFFVHDFDPESFAGGGWAYGGGMGSAKVVTSDANARHCVDFHHLAHELGHVVGLKHPDATVEPPMQLADTGTLMCSSGFKNDNPDVNSTGNAERLQNPLITFSHRASTKGPDCTDSDDCGFCP